MTTLVRNKLDIAKLRKAVAVGVGIVAATGITTTQINTHVDALVPAFEAYEIDTCDRVAAALAQFAHETGGFRWLKELGSSTYLRRYDGYHGRGYIHVTWLSNYKDMEDCTGIPLVKNPALLEKPEVAALVSACWWKKHNLNQVADRHDIKYITRVINGGYNGLPERLRYYRSIKAAFDKGGLCND